LAQGETVIPNPIPHDTFEELINAVFDWILNIALVLMPLLLVWGGVTFITASGDPGKVERGKDNFMDPCRLINSSFVKELGWNITRSC